VNQYLNKAIQIRDDKSSDQIAFMARSMVMATLPHSPSDELIYQRKNGHYILMMIANPQFGLPSGSLARMLLAWITREAVIKKSPELELGTSFKAFLKKLKLQNGGGKRGNMTRVRDQMMRLLTCSISCVYQDKRKGVCESDQFQVSRSFHFGWNPFQTGQGKEFLPESRIVLAKDFFDELIKQPVPVDFSALNLLRHSPLQMDIYSWLTYRFSFLKEETCVPWVSLKNQFGSDYSDDAQGLRNFKKKFIKALKKIGIVYPAANVSPIDKGILLYPSRTHINRKQKEVTDSEECLGRYFQTLANRDGYAEGGASLSESNAPAIFLKPSEPVDNLSYPR
jgi:hypothetical protein